MAPFILDFPPSSGGTVSNVVRNRSTFRYTHIFTLLVIGSLAFIADLPIAVATVPDADTDGVVSIVIDPSGVDANSTEGLSDIVTQKTIDSKNDSDDIASVFNESSKDANFTETLSDAVADSDDIASTLVPESHTDSEPNVVEDFSEQPTNDVSSNGSNIYLPCTYAIQCKRHCNLFFTLFLIHSIPK